MATQVVSTQGRPPVVVNVEHGAHVYRFEEVSPLRYLRARSTCPRPGYLTPVSQRGLGDEQARRFLAYRKPEVLACGFWIAPLGRTFEVGGIINGSRVRGLGYAAFLAAEALGATVLNCFDGYLPGLYARAGWIETSRVKFDPKLAPKQWNHERDGAPDLIFMQKP